MRGAASNVLGELGAFLVAQHTCLLCSAPRRRCGPHCLHWLHGAGCHAVCFARVPPEALRPVGTCRNNAVPSVARSGVVPTTCSGPLTLWPSRTRLLSVAGVCAGCGGRPLLAVVVAGPCCLCPVFRHGLLSMLFMWGSALSASRGLCSFVWHGAAAALPICRPGVYSSKQAHAACCGMYGLSHSTRLRVKSKQSITDHRH